MPHSKEPSRPRIIIIGAGSRGIAYARAVVESTTGIVASVADPIAYKRTLLGRKYIWGDGEPLPEQEFDDWQMFLKYEQTRRKREAAGELVERGVDAAFICTLDEQHAEIIQALAPLNLHLLCEKPLATSMADCLGIFSALQTDGIRSPQKAIFSVGHVLRYSPHNMLLRDLVLKDGVVGDVLSVEHTEPVGWWHFSHSYVRGNWRRESTTAPSLLTKSCHDIDFLMWLLCSPPVPETKQKLHLPARISSTGHLNQYRKARKPRAAGSATNCLSCAVEEKCNYSAKKIYVDRHLKKGHTDWPVKVVNPEIEECYNVQGYKAAETKLLASLAEDYDVQTTSKAEIAKRSWFGRCVWESDNDVCDDQTVTISWDDDDDDDDDNADIDAPDSEPTTKNNRFLSKTATFHMIAQTEAQCERRGRIYGTHGEISYDSKTIRVFNFGTGTSQTHNPRQPGGGHGGGDDGLIRQFVKAVGAVLEGEDVQTAQMEYVGCSLEDVVRSHAVVFAAEEARTKGVVVDWRRWWGENVQSKMGW